MLSEIAFLTLVAGVGLQRLWECRVSLAHERDLHAQGAIEHAHQQVPVMVALHAAWFLAMPLEVLLLGREPLPVLWLAALIVFALGQILRITAMRALGVHWTIKVITLPGTRAVAGGPFRRIRHPNYLGVLLETVALPMVHGAYLTACVFGLLQAIFLGLRIRAEEAALRQSTNYQDEMGTRPRFVPRMH